MLLNFQVSCEWAPVAVPLGSSSCPVRARWQGPFLIWLENALNFPQLHRGRGVYGELSGAVFSAILLLLLAPRPFNGKGNSNPIVCVDRVERGFH